MCNYNAYIGVTFSCFFSALLFFSFVGDADALTANDSVSTTDLAESLLFSILETVVFARIFLKELLADRNTVLAENIVSKMLFFFFVAVWYIASHSSWSYGIHSLNNAATMKQSPILVGWTNCSKQKKTAMTNQTMLYMPRIVCLVSLKRVRL